MRDGICPKCGSDEVYDDSSKSVFGVSNNDLMGITATSQARLQHYACANCGYTESYIKEDKQLDEIREKWNRTSKRKRGE